jgi:hypothetical protein
MRGITDENDAGIFAAGFAAGFIACGSQRI